MDELSDCLRAAHSDEDEELPDQESIRAMLTLEWSRVSRGDDSYVIHRVSYSNPDAEEREPNQADRITHRFCKEIRDRVSDNNPGLYHMICLASPTQLRENDRLFREVYQIEMKLREVISYIFLDQYPDRPYRFLDGNAVKLQGDRSNNTPEYLKAHDENQLFHILFNEYAYLNQQPVSKPQELVQLIREHADYAELHEALRDSPIREERHAALFAALQQLAPPVDDVRNAIMHNRELSRTVRENYDVVKPRFLDVIDTFWREELVSA